MLWSAWHQRSREDDNLQVGQIIQYRSVFKRCWFLIVPTPTHPGPLKTTGLLRRLYICCSECWLETRSRALGPPRSLVGTRLVVIVISILEEHVWGGNLFIFENCPHSQLHEDRRGFLSQIGYCPQFDSIIPQVWTIYYGDMISTMRALLVLQSSQPSLLPLFESIWIKFQLTGRELLRLMCRVRGVAPQVFCKNDQNVVEEEEDHVSNRENNNSTKMCKAWMRW